MFTNLQEGAMKGRGRIDVYASKEAWGLEVKISRPVAELRHALRVARGSNEVTETFKFTPGTTIVVRVRIAGTKEWLMGFECFDLGWLQLLELKNGIEYEVQVTRKNKMGEREPTCVMVRPDDGGNSGFLM